jgi:hypothetical protein
MPGIRPVFEKGPLTYRTTTAANGGLIKGGQLVEVDPNTGRIKVAGADSILCLGVATGDASPSDYSNANTTDSWGNPVVNAQYPPNEVAVAYQGVWRLLTTGTAGETQTITEGGSGLLSFTLTFDGYTTASLDDQATAAQIQTALEDLPNIEPGDVTVTGSAGGPYTVRFGGQYLGNNVVVPQMTATPTGGTGTVTIATTQESTADVIAFGQLVKCGADGKVAPYTEGASTMAQVIGRCVEPDGISAGLTGKILLGGVGA